MTDAEVPSVDVRFEETLSLALCISVGVPDGLLVREMVFVAVVTCSGVDERLMLRLLLRVADRVDTEVAVGVPLRGAVTDTPDDDTLCVFV